MYTIRAYYLQYCGSYAPHRRRRTMDDGRWTLDAGRWTMDTGRWTMDAGPSTPYYKLTGELKRLDRIYIKQISAFKLYTFAIKDTRVLE